MSPYNPEQGRQARKRANNHTRTTSAGTIDPKTGARIWRKRQAICDRLALDARATQGAKAWFALLAGRSDETGKPVWGNQEKMAAQLGRSSRSIRRYLVELETLGYVKVYRARPERGTNGQWTRRRSNSYYLRLPPTATAGLPAPRRRQKAGYCVFPPAGVPHLPDTDGRSSPQRGTPTSVVPPPDNNNSEMDTPDRPTEAQIAAVAALCASSRDRLRQSRFASARR